MHILYRLDPSWGCLGIGCLKCLDWNVWASNVWNDWIHVWNVWVWNVWNPSLECLGLECFDPSSECSGLECLEWIHLWNVWVWNVSVHLRNVRVWNVECLDWNAGVWNVWNVWIWNVGNMLDPSLRMFEFGKRWNVDPDHPWSLAKASRS